MHFEPSPPPGGDFDVPKTTRSSLNTSVTQAVVDRGLHSQQRTSEMTTHFHILCSCHSSRQKQRPLPLRQRICILQLEAHL